jgi:ABC-type transporter MlaC component
MVRLYARRFTGYDGRTFKVINQHTESDATTIINTEVYNPSARQLAGVAWRIHDGDAYKVLDMKVSGVSVMRLKREEFTSYLQRNSGNMSSLIRHLQDNNDTP